MQLGSHGVAVSSLCILRAKIPRAPPSPTQSDQVRLHAPILMRLRVDYGATFVSVNSCDRGVSLRARLFHWQSPGYRHESNSF